jgi:hypothetical protein
MRYDSAMRAFLLCMVLAGCGDDSTGSGLDGGGEGGAGQDASVADLAGLDSATAELDMTCVFSQFRGFPGTSASGRSYDCSCGCMIDNFEGPSVSTVWNNAGLAQAQYVPRNGAGLEVDVCGGDGGVGLAALNSLNPANQWFLHGDFDMQIDYKLLTALPPNGEAIFGVSSAQTPVNSTYQIERDTSSIGTGEYTGTVAGIQPVHVSTTATHGTLQLTRVNSVTTLQVLADGNQVTQYTGAIASNLAVIVTAGLTNCPGCSMSVQWHNLKLNHGLLVDQP